MKVWKITNNSKESVKIACKTASMHSKGIILSPGEFCISEAQLTASLDAQARRGFISIDEEFDNSKLKLEFVQNYSEKYLETLVKKINSEEESNQKSDFEKAAESVDKYINNQNS